MKKKHTLLVLIIMTLFAFFILLFTSKESPGTKTGTEREDMTASESNATEENRVSPTPSDLPATPAPTRIPKPLTPTPSPEPIDPALVDPDIPPVYNGSNYLPQYAKEKMFGNHTLTYWHFINHDPADTPVEKTQIDFGSPDDYTNVEGITTFRGNHYRDNASYGTRQVTEKKLELIWTKDIGSVSYENAYWPGVGWTGQPLIIRWEEDILQWMNIDPMMKKPGLVEVIYPTLDGNIYFLNLADGKQTRDPIDIGFPTKGTGMIDPRGYPLLYTGQGIHRNGDQFDYQKYRIFSLIDQNEIFSLTGTTPEAFRIWGAFDPSGLLDRKTDTLIQPGENGLLYRIKMNTQFDRTTGSLSIQPEITQYRYEPLFDPNIGYENSPVFYRNYLYLADNGGMLQCIDINSLEPVWVANLEDDTDSTLVLEETDEGVFLYTGNEADLRCLGQPQPAYADCQLRKFNALTGELIWEKPYRCIYQYGVNGGLLSTPVLGKNDIADRIIFNIAKTADSQTGTMVALDKKTGEEIWVKELDYYSWSSPVDFLSDSDRTYMIFCDFAGDMHLMDPVNGKVLDTLSVGANVEASPAIFNDMVVVGTYAKKIYGVKIK